MPDRDRHPALHPRDRDRQSARRRGDHLRAEHPRRHVRPRLPHRDSCAKRPACARRPRASRSRSASSSATRPISRCRRRRSSSPRAPSTGKTVAVVGAGPAGLACAHRLAVHGHDVDDLRLAAEARRPQRIRHRELQDARWLCAGRGRLRHRDRRDHHRAQHGARPRPLARGPRREVRRRVPRSRARRHQPASRRKRAGARLRGRDRFHRRAAPGVRSLDACRSAAGLW